MEFRGSLEKNISQLEARLEGVRGPPGDRGAMGVLQQLHKEGGSSGVTAPLLQIPPITVPVSCQAIVIMSYTGHQVPLPLILKYSWFTPKLCVLWQDPYFFWLGYLTVQQYISWPPPQLLLLAVRKKSCGVEPGNEASSVPSELSEDS